MEATARGEEGDHALQGEEGVDAEQDPPGVEAHPVPAYGAGERDRHEDEGDDDQDRRCEGRLGQAGDVVDAVPARDGHAAELLEQRVLAGEVPVEPDIAHVEPAEGGGGHASHERRDREPPAQTVPAPPRPVGQHQEQGDRAQRDDEHALGAGSGGDRACDHRPREPLPGHPVAQHPDRHQEQQDGGRPTPSRRSGRRRSAAPASERPPRPPPARRPPGGAARAHGPAGRRAGARSRIRACLPAAS